MIFQTDRLVIRRLDKQDLEPMFDMHRNPKVMQFVTGEVENIDETRKNLQDCIDCYGKPDNDFWIYAIDLKSTGEFIGTAALIKSEGGEDEVGYRFREKFWGNGFATETMKGLIDYCFNQLELPELYAVADVKNIASVKILDKLFVFQRQFFNEKEKCTDREYRLKKKLG